MSHFYAPGKRQKWDIETLVWKGLMRFAALVSLYNPQKTENQRFFDVFKRGIERDQWHEMF